MRVFFLAMVIISGMGYALYSCGHGVAGLLGLQLREVFVPGKNRTDQASIFWALRMTKNHHMWQEPLKRMHERLESLPWVKSATIQRRLPWTLVVTLVEKTPVAIWQNKGKKCVIDEDGNPIKNALPKDFSDLILITGSQAPKHIHKLLHQLPKIGSLPPVKAASFLRSQRWDLYLQDGTRILLPQEKMGKALGKLMGFWSFLRGSPLIDLRFPDALIFTPCE